MIDIFGNKFMRVKLILFLAKLGIQDAQYYIDDINAGVPPRKR